MSKCHETKYPDVYSTCRNSLFVVELENDCYFLRHILVWVLFERDSSCETVGKIKADEKQFLLQTVHLRFWLRVKKAKRKRTGLLCTVSWLNAVSFLLRFQYWTRFPVLGSAKSHRIIVLKMVAQNEQFSDRNTKFKEHIKVFETPIILI